MPVQCFDGDVSRPAGYRERCLEAGMDSYVSKPIQPQELFDTIDAVMAAQENDLPANGQKNVTAMQHEFVKG